MNIEGVYKVTNKRATNPIFVKVTLIDDGCALQCINTGAVDVFKEEKIREWLNDSHSNDYIIERSDEIRAHHYKKMVHHPFGSEVVRWYSL